MLVIFASLVKYIALGSEHLGSLHHQMNDTPGKFQGEEHSLVSICMWYRLIHFVISFCIRFYYLLVLLILLVDATGILVAYSTSDIYIYINHYMSLRTCGKFLFVL